MRVNIGPYVPWIGVYQLANALQRIGLSEERCEKIGDWLADTWIDKALYWIHGKLKRKVKIRIDPYDTWNMNDTLAVIILPMLKQLKEHKHGSPQVADEDVPEYLRSTAAPPKENEWDTDALFHDRWDWVMSEMIWAFEQLQPDVDWELQFSSGVFDTKWKKREDGTHEMVYGPNHTYEFDTDGAKAWKQRIDNGLRLFGVYYSCLWD